MEKKRGGKRIAGEGKKIGRPTKPSTYPITIRVKENTKEIAKEKISEFVKKEKL